MINNIKFLNNYFDKELIVLSKNNNINSFLLENKLLSNNILIEEDLDNREKNIFFICKKNKIHIVKPGETIKSICLKYNINEDELIKSNNLKTIFIGQQINI